jgi:hypothetical protein
MATSAAAETVPSRFETTSGQQECGEPVTEAERDQEPITEGAVAEFADLGWHTVVHFITSWP